MRLLTRGMVVSIRRHPTTRAVKPITRHKANNCTPDRRLFSQNPQALTTRMNTKSHLRILRVKEDELSPSRRFPNHRLPNRRSPSHRSPNRRSLAGPLKVRSSRVFHADHSYQGWFKCTDYQPKYGRPPY